MKHLFYIKNLAYNTDFANLPLGINRFHFSEKQSDRFVNDVEKTKNQTIVEKNESVSFFKDQN